MTKVVVYQGLGGSRRLESGEHHECLDSAFNAGKEAKIQGEQPALKGMPNMLRQEWMAGYNSVRCGGDA